MILLSGSTSIVEPGLRAHTIREPVGLCGIITSYNYPLGICIDIFTFGCLIYSSGIVEDCSRTGLRKRDFSKTPPNNTIKYLAFLQNCARNTIFTLRYSVCPSRRCICKITIEPINTYYPCLAVVRRMFNCLSLLGRTTDRKPSRYRQNQFYRFRWRWSTHSLSVRE